jgi:hypothetical protein
MTPGGSPRHCAPCRAPVGWVQAAKAPAARRELETILRGSSATTVPQRAVADLEALLRARASSRRRSSSPTCAAASRREPRRHGSRAREPAGRAAPRRARGTGPAPPAALRPRWRRRWRRASSVSSPGVARLGRRAGHRRQAAALGDRSLALADEDHLAYARRRAASCARSRRVLGRALCAAEVPSIAEAAADVAALARSPRGRRRDRPRRHGRRHARRGRQRGGRPPRACEPRDAPRATGCRRGRTPRRGRRRPRGTSRSAA